MPSHKRTSGAGPTGRAAANTSTNNFLKTIAAAVLASGSDALFLKMTAFEDKGYSGKCEGDYLWTQEVLS